MFSLECLSEILPDHQADILFDNIQYLSDSMIPPEEQAENLHVFVLNGWGERDSASPDEVNNDPQHRRKWTCWCAAHRPQMPAPSNDDPPTNLIILEFELEKDVYNPLYPLPTDESGSSGVTSPASVSGSTSESSGRTLVSSSEGEYLTTTGDESASLVNSSGSAARNAQPASPAEPANNTEAAVAGEWLPSSEAILESTTSCSKPLPALERLRRSRRGADEGASAATSVYGNGNGNGRGRGGAVRPCRENARRRRGSSAVGMMDVFAVMGQINEQFGAAADMESFLKIVAGVIKDITQFHRVLVYQFDEQWNGQVMAELMDWSRSHDLYMGLHFPASDIPAQVCAHILTI